MKTKTPTMGQLNSANTPTIMEEDAAKEQASKTMLVENGEKTVFV